MVEALERRGECERGGVRVEGGPVAGRARARRTAHMSEVGGRRGAKRGGGRSAIAHVGRELSHACFGNDEGSILLEIVDTAASRVQ